MVVDANVSGWSGCIFRLTEVEPGINYPLPFSLSGVLSTHEKELIPNGKSVGQFTLIPVRFDGSHFNFKFKTQQSSTWYERAAAMLIIHRNKEVLSGKVYILSDNKNLVGSWKDTESLTDSLCCAFATYIGHGHGAILVRRSHPVLSWVDQCARKFKSFDEDQRLFMGLSLQISEFDEPSTSVKKLRTLVTDANQDVEMVDTESPDSPEEFAVEQFVENHSKSEVEPLLKKEWIIAEGKNFYITEKFPGNVLTHSLLIPADQGPAILHAIHHDYGHATIAGMRKMLSLWKL